MEPENTGTPWQDEDFEDYASEVDYDDDGLTLGTPRHIWAEEEQYDEEEDNID